MRNIQCILIILLFAASVQAQLMVYAGNDTSGCNGINFDLNIGGNPTASGGTEPYTYSWTLLNSTYEATALSTADILLDTLNANPGIKVLPPDINDTLLLEVLVFDINQDSGRDTVQIIISSLPIMNDIYYNPTVNAGDSIKIRPINIVNGIPPFSYEWNPKSWLSNSFVKEPVASPEYTKDYTVLVKDALGCTALDHVKITVLGASSILNKGNNTFQSSVVPNPIQAHSKIELPLNHDLKEIRVFNAAGQALLIDVFREDSYPLENKFIFRGVYYYQISNDNHVISSGTFIKE